MASRWDRKGEEGAILPGAPFFAPQRPEGRLTPGEVTRESLVRWLEEGGNVAGRLLGLPAWARGKGFFGDTVEEGWDALRRLDAVYEGSGPLVSEGEGITVSPHDASEADDRVLDRAGEWLLGESSVGEAKAVEDRTGPEEARRRKKLLRRIEKIRQDLAGLPDPEKSRRQADALAACLHCISRGDEEAFVPDPEGGGDEIRIPLDPRLSPGENLNRQHALAKKAIRVRKIAETRLAEAEAELATPPAQVPSTSPQPTQSEARHAQKFRRYRSSDGWLILVGKNRVENDLLLRQAKPWDLWLHARDGAGAHVLLIKPGRDSKPPERTLAEAAGLAALFSSRSSEVRVEIMLAEASRVKKPKGAGPGRVIVSGEKTMLVSPGAGNPQPV
jgi:predicted ribosome quality control (RQC) complex YloA/Tae2 family protein